MYAMRMNHLGAPADLVEVELPEAAPGPGQVAIEVHAIGCNFADLLIVAGKYQLKPPLPFSPGSEVCGVIRAVGPGVETLRPGARVFAVLPWGGYASYVLAPAAVTVELPDSMTFEEGAAFGVAYQTSQVALIDRAQLRPGEVLVVHGAAGGVGLAAVEIGAACGARVVGVARGAEKLELVRHHGAALAVDVDDDWPAQVREFSAGRGADVIYDPVGGETFRRSVKVLAFGGRLLVIGFASGEIPSLEMNRLLLKNVAVIGVNWGAYRDAHPEELARATGALFRTYAAGQLRPHVSATFPLREAAAALAEIESRRSSGKVILLP